MNPTKAQKIASLEIARGRIESGENDSICYALAGTPAGEYLSKYARDALGTNYCYSNWLRHTRQAFFRRINCGDSGCKEGRIQWINWMIANAT